MSPVLREAFRVRASEIGPGGTMRLPALPDLFQESAGNRATALGWGSDALLADGRTWVLSRFHLRLWALPAWREDIAVETWPSGVHRVFALREFRATGAAGRLLAEARYWDAIQILEAAVPRMQPQQHQHRARILLARAYAKNPNWLRQAQDQLREVVREDPNNADALYELGLVYKAGGLVSRANAMFRRAVEAKPDHRGAGAELGVTHPASSGGLLKKLFKRGRAS